MKRRVRGALGGESGIVTRKGIHDSYSPGLRAFPQTANKQKGKSGQKKKKKKKKRLHMRTN